VNSHTPIIYSPSPVSKMRRIWCYDCRVVQMQFKQTNGSGHKRASRINID